jgi:hypothetical protein
MVGSVCRVKQFTTGSRNSLTDVQKLQMIAQSVMEGAEATVKDFSGACFYTLVKMGQVYQCWWRIYREKNVFSVLNSHILYPFVTYLLILPRILNW